MAAIKGTRFHNIYVGGQWTRSHMQEINMWEDMGDRHESEL